MPTNNQPTDRDRHDAHRLIAEYCDRDDMGRLREAIAQALANTRVSRPDEAATNRIRKHQSTLDDLCMGLYCFHNREYHLPSGGCVFSGCSCTAFEEAPTEAEADAGSTQGIDPTQLVNGSVVSVEVAALRVENTTLALLLDSESKGRASTPQEREQYIRDVERVRAESRAKVEELKRERDELSEEMESCHAMLDLHYQEDPQSCSADTLEQRVQVHLTEANVIREEAAKLRAENEALKRPVDEARLKAIRERVEKADLQGAQE